MAIESISLSVNYIGEFRIIRNIPDNGNNEWIVYLHGLPGGPVDQLKEYLELFGKYGYSSIIFNYPGLWDSPGRLSYDDLFKVLESIFVYLNNLNPNKIHLFGESFGGLVTVNIIANDFAKIGKVVLRSPLMDVKPILNFLPSTIGYLKSSGVMNSDSNILNDLERMNPPKLFSKTASVKFWGVIGKNDDVLPGEAMFDITKGFDNINLELWDDFPHNFTEPEIWKEFVKKMFDFLK